MNVCLNSRDSREMPGSALSSKLAYRWRSKVDFSVFLDFIWSNLVTSGLREYMYSPAPAHCPCSCEIETHW